MNFIKRRLFKKELSLIEEINTIYLQNINKHNIIGNRADQINITNLGPWNQTDLLELRKNINEVITSENRILDILSSLSEKKRRK